MMRTFLIVTIFLSLGLTLQQDKESDSLVGRFVAFDKLQGLTNPREPRQQFVFGLEDGSSSNRGLLVRLIYFPETTSLRGGAKFLTDDKLAYSNRWNLRVHQPRTTNERSACKDVDDFFRAADGSIDENEKHEPMLRYRSTQTKADLRFDGLSTMPCLILDSMHLM